MKKLNQNGFGLIPVLLIVAVIGLVAFAGYRVMNKDTPIADSSSQLSRDSPAPEGINNASDIDAASKALDDTPVDSGMNAEQLDSDIESLL